MRSSSFIPYPPSLTTDKNAQSVKGVADFLQSHDKMRLLLPNVTRLAALQKACQAVLPVIFDTCAVLQFDVGQLLIGTSNASMAAKLKQQLPKLQDVLQKQGWQVNAIRLKVQVGKTVEKSNVSKQLALSNHAVSAFAALETALSPSSRNAALKFALQAMVQRHRSKE
jgi:hypothetical protein